MNSIIAEKLYAIAQGYPEGIMPFDAYMQVALYDPVAGYYTTRVTLGRSGDFVTAPEISSLFAKAIAVQYLEYARDDNLTIFEFGAGTGKLALDLLTSLFELDRLPKQYCILDVSGHLQSLQQTTLAQLPAAAQSCIKWCDALPLEPMDGFVIANEVLDAMPVKKILFDGEAMHELGVAFGRDGLELRPLPKPDPRLEHIVPKLLSEAIGGLRYETEVNLNIAPWLSSLSHLLNRAMVLLIDYGFPRHELYHPERDGGTIMCHSRQTAHTDPLHAPGAEDITAHVDFTAVAEAAIDAGFDVDGYTSQAHFLLSLGILEQACSIEDRQAVKLLTMPQEMGELFKVMALTKGGSGYWRGFALDDRRGRL